MGGGEHLYRRSAIGGWHLCRPDLGGRANCADRGGGL